MSVALSSCPTGDSARRQFSIAGRRFALEAVEPRLMEIATRYLDHHHFAASADGTPDGRMILEWLSDPEPPMPVVERFDVTRGTCSTDGRRYVLDVEESVVVVEREPLVRVRIGNNPRALGRHSVNNVISYATQALMRRLRRYDCHAAALVPPGGSGAMLFAGGSGHGKTTLALQLAGQGWRYLSDDFVVFSDRDGTVEAHALRRRFAATAESLVPFSKADHAFGGAMASDPRKRLVDPDRLFPNQFVSAAPVSVLLFPHVTHESHTRLRPLTPSEALGRMMRNCPWSAYDLVAARDFLALLGRLTAQAQSFSLESGLDLVEQPGLVHGLLLPLQGRR